MRAIWLGLSFIIFSTSAFADLVYRTGNPNDIQRPTRQVTCLAGGGDDNLWIEGWKYLLTNSGGGDIVIIRADGSRGGYESWIYKDSENNKMPKVNSVSVISLKSKKDANDPQISPVLQNAEMIFLAGGDQDRYISWFEHSLLEKEVVAAVHQRKIPIAGTSAGMAVLAGIDFRARFDSPVTGGMVTSQDALMDPTNHIMDMNKQVFAGAQMKSVVTDTHFSQRNRHGRLVGMMAKAVYQNLASIHNVRALASDEGTAFCYNHSGVGRAYGVGQVYFLKPLVEPEILKPGQALTWLRNENAIEATVLSHGSGLFDITRSSFISDESEAQGNFKKEFWSVSNGALLRAPFEHR